MEMRTFLYKLKGELFSKAREHPGENMTWELMAERLSPASGRQIVLDQESAHSSLTDTLSRVGKGRPSAFDFNEAWARFVDHVFSVCGEVLPGTSARS